MDPDQDDPPVLSVGVMDGGSNDGGACANAAMALARQVKEARLGVASPLNVNVVFQVAGRNFVPEFEGVRTGRYSNRQSHLMVQVAVYPDAVTDPTVTVLALLGDAVAEAEAWARRRKVADSLDGLTTLVGTLAAEG